MHGGHAGCIWWEIQRPKSNFLQSFRNLAPSVHHNHNRRKAQLPSYLRRNPNLLLPSLALSNPNHPPPPWAPLAPTGQIRCPICPLPPPRKSISVTSRYKSKGRRGLLEGIFSIEHVEETDAQSPDINRAVYFSLELLRCHVVPRVLLHVQVLHCLVLRFRIEH